MIRKIALVVLCAIAITLMMPQRAMMDVYFMPGEIWESETLIAPFDIPIYKEPQQLTAERKALQESYQPLFRMDTTVGRLQMQQLTAELEANDTLPDPDREHILGIFQHVYQVGILTEADWTTYLDRIVRVDSAQMLRAIPGVDLFTPGTAQTHLADHGVGQAEYYAKYFSPSLIYDNTLNAKLRDEMFSRLSETEGVIRSGEVVVAKGQMIDQHSVKRIDSFLQEYESRLGIGKHGIILLVGRFLMILAILSASFIYFQYFTPPSFFENQRALLYVFTLYLMMAILMGLVVRARYLSPYIVPLPVVALLLLAFFNTRVAIFGNLVASLMAAFFVRYNFEFFTVNFLGGMVAIFVTRHNYHRTSIFKSAGAIFIVEALLYYAFQWTASGTLAVNYKGITWFLTCAFLTLGFYQLVYIFERIFGFVSDVTLLELSDTNEPLLLELAEKAPGTFQHIVQVASLAESAAKEVGANPLLARAGALYHDVGKIQNPYYFIENQRGGFNPHSVLEPEQSAGIVRSHVTDGIALARKYKLPSLIQEFISGHHGTSKIYYFYAQEMEKKGKVEHIEEFTYPGPKPVRKEVAICMIADAVEAASRSLQDYEGETIGKMVDKIVDRQIEEHQFSNAMLSFAEVTKIKELFKAKLHNIYHGRVVYPDPPIVTE